MAAWVPPQPRRCLQREPFSSSNGNWGEMESEGKSESGPPTARGKFRVQNPGYLYHVPSISNSSFQNILKGIRDWDVKNHFGTNPKQKGDVETCGKRRFLQPCGSFAWKPSHRCSLDLWQESLIFSASFRQASRPMFCIVLLKCSTHGTMALWLKKDQPRTSKNGHSPIAPVADPHGPGLESTQS